MPASAARTTVLGKFMVEHEHGIADFHFSVRQMGQSLPWTCAAGASGKSPWQLFRRELFQGG
jgi:hypothetical protein